MNIGRTFEFAEADDIGQRASGSKNLVAAYTKGVEEARLAFKEVERLKSIRLPKSSNDRQSNMSMALNSFQFIKTNKPVGNVKVNKRNLTKKKTRIQLNF